MKTKFFCLAATILFLVGSQANAQCSGSSCRSSQAQLSASFGTCASGNCSSASQSYGYVQGGYYLPAASAPTVTYRYVDPPVARYTAAPQKVTCNGATCTIQETAPAQFATFAAPPAQIVTSFADCPNGTCANCQCPSGACQNGACPAHAATKASAAPKVEWKLMAYGTQEAALLIDGNHVGSMAIRITQKGTVRTVHTDWQPIVNGQWGERVEVASKVEYVSAEPIPFPPMPTHLPAR